MDNGISDQDQQQDQHDQYTPIEGGMSQHEESPEQPPAPEAQETVTAAEAPSENNQQKFIDKVGTLIDSLNDLREQHA